MPHDKRIFIVANRLPVSVSDSEGVVDIKPTTGGLVTAVSGYLQNVGNEFSEFYWVGVPGCTATVWNEAVNRLPQSKFTYLPVMLFHEQYESYYSGFSNSVLWPLFHYFPSYAEYSKDEFEAYMQVNAHFAEVLERNCRPGDTVWIHDYHLLPLAGMLRKAFPEITIGFFLHIPFPSFEIFRLLPKMWQEQLLRGMLGADLVGFHTMSYATHFLQCVQYLLGINHERHILRYRKRLVKVDVFPISIDYAKFSSASQQDSVVALRQSIREKMNGWKLLFSVDRLDYTKGMQNRLKGFEEFLQNNPEYHNKVAFIMVVVPSRDNISKYAERKRTIEETISRINGTWGTLHWQPIFYQYNTLAFEQMVALYTLCDIALITPLRDGMNLVSKEFVASRTDKKGVLVLSEMAGAANELTDALIINPNDPQEIAEKIKEGLEMPEKEQCSRIEKMQKRIAHYDVNAWADDFMSGLTNIKIKQKHFQEIFLDEYSKINLLDCYRAANKRLLLLDYDGTLVPYAATPQMATPHAPLLELLSGLSAQSANDVVLISGRKSDWLEKHFSHLPMTLVAEDGAKVKLPGIAWTAEVPTYNEWKSSVCKIMEMYERRCPQSFIEEKEFSVVWHYRNADPEQGPLRCMELVRELNDHLYDPHLEVTTGNKVVEVRNRGINKGSAIKKIIDRKPYDFIFAVGDDKTDEDMFKALVGRQDCYTIKVGPNASYAQFNLLRPQMVTSLLEAMNQISVKQSRFSSGQFAFPMKK